MCGAIPPLPNTPSWHGAQLKIRTIGIRQRISSLVDELLTSQEGLCTMELALGCI
jgi:hypothetical protein